MRIDRATWSGEFVDDLEKAGMASANGDPHGPAADTWSRADDGPGSRSSEDGRVENGLDGTSCEPRSPSTNANSRTRCAARYATTDRTGYRERDNA